MIDFPVETKYDKKWLLIFHHVYLSEDDLWTEEEVLKSSTKNKYSILGELDDSFRFQGRFEFLLEYTGIEGYNIWSQTKNPVKAKPNVENGFKEIKCSWKNNSFHGLAQSSSPAAFIDGSPFNDNSYFYAIGLFKNWCNAIPGPYSCTTKITSNEVFLYVRINSQCSHKARYYHCNMLHVIQLMICS